MAFLTSPFTATKTQVATYLLGVALFSISFLVFLNSTVSFVVTELIGHYGAVGDAVGTLGFADEVLVIIMCPIWGVVSDTLGVRTVAVTGYAIVGLSLFVFVQARNVYPQLLLARMLFSVGAAATATMVTAILPTMTQIPKLDSNDLSFSQTRNSTASESTITPSTFQAQNSTVTQERKPARSSTSQIAGLVGMFTGVGALLALGVFLPLPARLGEAGYSRAGALKLSFYLVGSAALTVGVACFFGLRNLPGEEAKGFHTWKSIPSEHSAPVQLPQTWKRATRTSARRLAQALRLGFTDRSIGLAYLGGFVARASSVAITLFIPLYVNSYFIRNGRCPSHVYDPQLDPHDPNDIKAHCRRAYTLAASLSGASQAVALIAAPIFGWIDGRLHGLLNAPLVFAAAAGVLGYSVLAGLDGPESGALVWICMVLLGIGQIGAIVCSLSSLSRGIDGANDGTLRARDYEALSRAHEDTERPELTTPDIEHNEEHASLLQPQAGTSESAPGADPDMDISSRSHLKGSIAGVYSLSGGAGILLLTKLGGRLFDDTSPGAPFAMLAVFNAVLLVVGLGSGILHRVKARRKG